MRAKRTTRRSRHASLKELGLGQTRDVPGHWQGDLIALARGSHVVTLVKRQSRYVILAKVANKQTAIVVSALIGQARITARRTSSHGGDLSPNLDFRSAVVDGS